MIHFERTDTLHIRIDGSPAELISFSLELSKSPGVIVEFDMPITVGMVVFPSGSPLLALLPPTGSRWSAVQAYTDRDQELARREMERQEAYDDWMDRNLAAKRGVL